MENDSQKNFALEIPDDALGVSQDELVFQDIPHSHKTSASPELKDGRTVHTHTFTNFPNPEDSEEEDKAELIKDKKTPSFWTFEYYQTFFDVDSKQVLDRILWSMYPNPNVNYLQMKIRPNPDLYGPFWICMTLVFSVAVAGNLANYLYSQSTSSSSYVWKYDFHKVTLASAAIFAYWWLMPTMLYGLLSWRGNQAGYTFTEIICIYGYSLAIYIPISILWVLPFYWLQWLLVMLGMALSGTVLVFTLWPSIRHDKKQVSLSTMVIVMLMHGLLAVGFMLFFFHGSVDTAATGTTAAVYQNVTSSAMVVSTTQMTQTANLTV